jgi:hypothetical protein
MITLTKTAGKPQIPNREHPSIADARGVECSTCHRRQILPVAPAFLPLKHRLKSLCHRARHLAVSRSGKGEQRGVARHDLLGKNPRDLATFVGCRSRHSLFGHPGVSTPRRLYHALRSILGRAALRVFPTGERTTGRPQRATTGGRAQNLPYFPVNGPQVANSPNGALWGYQPENA